MASIATHFSAFLLLFPVGLRRLHSSSSLYLHSPSQFRSKLWYLSDPKWKNLDLYALLITLPIASFSELFLFLSFSGHPSYRFSFFQQSFALLAFWFLILLIIVHEYNATSSLISETLVYVLGGVVFFMEYSVMETGVSGLAADVYGFIGWLALLCAGSCIYLSFKPSAFFAEFLLCCGLVFKGTWLLQGGFLLYTDALGLKGCKKISSLLLMSTQDDVVDVHCELEQDKARGFALVNFLFTLHALVVMVLAVGLVVVLGRNRSLRTGGGEGKGPLLSEIEATNIRMRALPELEIE
ncbi:hypothetical protein HN51_047444 [Arachis hypogaea]|uniref:uncharacterized protein LOC110262353 n=1 Tax=Arachis ipaensis TaxID=130454 RepID=UPI0007AF6838|nr:uncharacterized protein LOC110262353 [Arachis ipaensis]XP_025632871.1 uncharacterized protein LOC112727368 [Arachis hypogaea]QHO23809.1 uncharacterized protein DS421_12g366730 [Arachis hypogaea]